MKVSKLITELKSLQDTHDDLDIFLDNCFGAGYEPSITGVIYINADTDNSDCGVSIILPSRPERLIIKGKLQPTMLTS